MKHSMSRIFGIGYVVLSFAICSIGATNAAFVDESTLEGHLVSTTCWEKPLVPTHVYPPDGTVAGPGSDWLANPYVDWSDATTTCPLSSAMHYQYQSYHDGSLTQLAYQSGLLVNSQIPAPNTPDGDYYWRVRAFDGYTYSDWSAPWLLTVDRTEVPSISSGDVVINEIMWMGSHGGDGGGSDEWIELRNMTGSPIDLTSWIIENAGTGSSGVTLSGTIAPNAFFLASNNPSTSSNIADVIIPDQVTSAIQLNNTGEQLVLKNELGMVIDLTPVTSGSWAQGLHSGNLRKSMERNNVPGDGVVAGSWHTCISDTCNDTVFWDTEGNNYGTPRAANHSENDPTVTIQPNVELCVVEEHGEKNEPSPPATVVPATTTPTASPIPALTPTPTTSPEASPSATPVVEEITEDIVESKEPPTPTAIAAPTPDMNVPAKETPV